MRRRALAAVVALSACDAGTSAPPWWPAANGPMPAEDPAIATQAALGRLLFYDPILSADGETACATCHSELWGMSDGLAKSIGVGGGHLTGPGRVGPNVLTRNAPSLWNVAFRDELFWDGRETSLEAQVLLPMAAPDELGREASIAVAHIRDVPEYVTLFAAAFPTDAEPVSVPNLQHALAAFQRTLVSDDSLWDAWIDDDPGALSADMQRGFAVFVDVGCDGCHVPPMFEADTYARRRPLAEVVDVGRFAVTQREADRGAFRTPTLRNVRESGPYMHDGSDKTLDDAVRSELAADGVSLPDADVAALVAFLGRGLVDRSREPDRPETVPSGLPVPEDGFRIPR